MKFLRIVLLLVGLLATLRGDAFAAEKTREVTFTNEQAFVLVDALRNKMDGYDKILNEGGRERVVRVLYQFEIATRLAIARNMVPLDAMLGPIEKARQSRVMELSQGTGTIAKDSPANGTIVAEWNEIMARKNAYNLITLTTDELKLKDNPIPASVLNSLLLILE